MRTGAGRRILLATGIVILKPVAWAFYLQRETLTFLEAPVWVVYLGNISGYAGRLVSYQRLVVYRRYFSCGVRQLP